MMGWCGWDHMGGWGWVATSLGLLMFLGLLAFVAWLVVRVPRFLGDGSPRPARTSGETTAEQLLADRFARGEIDEDEYRRRLATLRSVGAGPGTW